MSHRLSSDRNSSLHSLCHQFVLDSVPVVHFAMSARHWSSTDSFSWGHDSITHVRRARLSDSCWLAFPECVIVIECSSNSELPVSPNLNPLLVNVHSYLLVVSRNTTRPSPLQFIADSSNTTTKTQCSSSVLTSSCLPSSCTDVYEYVLRATSGICITQCAICRFAVQMAN